MKTNYLKLCNFLFIFVVISSLALSLPVTDTYETWHANQGTDDDNIIWRYDDIDFEVNGITDSAADFVCYDWDDDGTYDNCNYDSDGCGGGGCDTESCNYYAIPNSMSDSWKESCNVEGACREGTDFNHRVCDGCDWDTSNTQSTYVDAVVYYDCDNSTGKRGVDSLDPVHFWVVYGHQYDCDGGTPTDPDYEGSYEGTWKNIDSNTGICASSEECDENHDQGVSYSRLATPSDPCRTKNGYSCSADSDCLTDHCVSNVCRPDPYCGDMDCDGGETYSSCPQDCCGSDCTEVIYEVGSGYCRSACDTYNDCSYYSSSTKTACNGDSVNTYECVDADTRVYCCEGTPVDCSSNEYCTSGSCSTCSTVCDSSCQSSACYGTDPDCDSNGDPTVQCADNADLAILDIIPIQVIPDVDMVKGKSGYVRVIVHNYGPKNATGQVNVTFDGSALPPYNPLNASNFILNGTNSTFDFSFYPDSAGSNIVISANVTIIN
jgi:hypothetical protein